MHINPSRNASYLVIGIGQNNHYYTLREMWYDVWCEEPHWECDHIMNLSQNIDEAIEKAQYQSKLKAMELRVNKEEIEQEMFKIHRANAEEMERREREKQEIEIKRQQRQAEYKLEIINKINNDIMPFGQFADVKFESVPCDYVQWILKSENDDEVWNHLKNHIRNNHPEFILPVADPKAVIGVAGEQVEVDVRVVRKAHFDGQYGRIYIISMVSNDGVMLVSKGAFYAEIGQKLRIKGRIKKHDEYNGQMQSVIQRVKIKKEYSFK